MRYILTLIISIFVFQFSISQDALKKANVQLSGFYPEEPLAIIDRLEQPNLFFVGKEEITQLIFKNNKENIHNKIPRPPEPYNKIEGLNITKDNAIDLYFSNPRRDAFFLISIKENEKLFLKRFDLNFDRKEQFLKTINYKNNFYLLSFTKGESIIHIYSFDKAGQSKRSYDLSDYNFLDKSGNSTSLSKLLKQDETEIIEEGIPYSLEIASRKTKLYPKGDSLMVTLDYKNNRTQIISLNFKNEEHSFFYIENNKAEETKKFNSFIYQNKLFQISASDKILGFTIDDLLTKRNISKNVVIEGDDFILKNLPIIQKGNSPYFSIPGKKIKEISRIKEFLRKLLNSDIGIYVYENNQILDITLGGVKEFTVGSSNHSGFNHMASQGFLGHSIPSVSWSYASYNSSRSIFTKLLFNSKTLEHVDQKAKNNVFDRIDLKSRYLKNTLLKKKIKYESIFKMNDFFVFGYYNKKDKTYTLLRFDK